LYCEDEKDVSASMRTLDVQTGKRIRYGALWRKSIKGEILKGKEKLLEA